MNPNETVIVIKMDANGVVHVQANTHSRVMLMGMFEMAKMSLAIPKEKESTIIPATPEQTLRIG